MSGAKLIGLVLVFMLGVGGLAALALGAMSLLGVGGGSEDDRRPVLREAGGTLEPGSDGLELLKALGGASCTAKEEDGERWVFRIRPDRAADGRPDCLANPGDLVVWLKERKIVAFEPVHGESERVQDAEGFKHYQRRYGRNPVEEKAPIDQVVQFVAE